MPLDTLLGTGGRRHSGHGHVNENGLLSGTNDILAEPLCSLGLTCDECKGLLQGTQPILGEPLNALGLGVDCDGENNGGNGGNNGNGGCGGDNNSGHGNGKGHCKSCGKNNGCKSCGRKNNDDEHKVPIDAGDCGCDRKALDIELDGETQ